MSLFVLFGQSQKGDTPDKLEYDREETSQNMTKKKKKTTRREKMKKLAILSPLVILMASTSLAQDSCIVRPSCADMGYTKTIDDCTGKTTLKCPFDLTAVSCSASEAAIECDWGYELTSDNSCKKIENAIAFVVETTINNGSITLATGSTNNFTVDWGDGTVENYTNTSAPIHYYVTAGQYPIIITGTVPSFKVSKLTNCNTIKILNADLESVTSYAASSISSTFGKCSNATGEIPQKLSPNLKTATNMFYGCSGLYGDIPELPSTITAATYMFYNCSGLTGEIKSLPSGISNGSYMFYGCKNLTGSIPNLPSSLTNGSSMFAGSTKLTGFNFSAFPTSLANGTSMFANCTGLTGSIPELPNSLSNANSMFNGCTSLTGIGSSKFPISLTDGYMMFYNCYKLTGNVPSLANTRLTDGRGMFYNCWRLTGNVPELPSTLKDVCSVSPYRGEEGFSMFGSSGFTGIVPKLSHTAITDATGMFYEAAISGITDFPKGLTNAGYMFYGCDNLGSIGDLPSGLTDYYYMFKNSSLTSIGNLPTNITELEYMFENCKKLTSLPPNFASLTSLTTITQSFRGCTSLTGTLPPFSNYPAMRYTTSAFEGTQLTNNPTSPWPDEAW